MSTLKERVDAVFEERKRHDPTWSYRKWSDAAELNPTAVGTVIGRLRKKPDASIETKTLEAMARGAGVPVSRFIGDESQRDMPIGTLLLRIAEAPGLRSAIEKDPGRWRVSTLVAVFDRDDWKAAPPKGWARHLDFVQIALDEGRELKKERIAKKRSA